MTANVQHFRTVSGEDITLTVYARNDSNIPQDLTGRKVTFRMERMGKKDGTTLVASAGSYAVRLHAHATDQLRGTLKYDCLLDDGSIFFANNSYGGLRFVNNSGGALQFINSWSEPMDFFNASTHGSGALQFVNNDGDPLNFVNGNANDVRVVTSGRIYLSESVR